MQYSMYQRKSKVAFCPYFPDITFQKS